MENSEGKNNVNHIESVEDRVRKGGAEVYAEPIEETELPRDEKAERRYRWDVRRRKLFRYIREAFYAFRDLIPRRSSNG